MLLLQCFAVLCSNILFVPKDFEASHLQVRAIK
jgi:hypothetical protein